MHLYSRHWLKGGGGAQQQSFRQALSTGALPSFLCHTHKPCLPFHSGNARPCWSMVALPGITNQHTGTLGQAVQARADKEAALAEYERNTTPSFQPNEGRHREGGQEGRAPLHERLYIEVTLSQCCVAMCVRSTQLGAHICVK